MTGPTTGAYLVQAIGVQSGYTATVPNGVTTPTLVPRPAHGGADSMAVASGAGFGT